MATSFTSFVDSTNFFTLATFPNEVSIRDISRSLANCRLDPFDPSEMVARKEKESLASNIEHGVFRASRQADLSGNLCYSVDGVYFWPGLTERYTCGRKVVDATISRVLVKFLEAKRKSGEIGMNRVLEEFAMRLALGRLVQMNCSSSSFVFVFIFESTSFDLSN